MQKCSVFLFPLQKYAGIGKDKHFIFAHVNFFL